MNFDKIQAVVILEQTQLYKGKSKWGVSFGSDLSDGRVIAMDDSVPAGAKITFSITYKGGKKKLVKLMSGTPECDQLLKMALDPSSADDLSVDGTTAAKEYTPVTLQKNQLPSGYYHIGKDIPAGTYDFTWIFGNGQIMKFENENDKTLGATNYFENMGAQYDYQYRQCLNVKCDDGELLHLNGNMIVSIAKSKKIELDL